MMWSYLLLTLAFVFTSAACTSGKSGDEGENNNPPNGGKRGKKKGTISAPDCSDGEEKEDIDDDVPTWIKENFTCIKAYMDDDNIVIETQDLPPYKSYYYGASHDLYEAMPSGNNANPNSIEVQNYKLTIPSDPETSSSSSDTEMDAIGVTVKGTALYNNEAAPGDSLQDELETMDDANGHPTNIGSYHHHTEPTKITNNDDKLVGILLDGFPVYGRKDENNTTPNNLDACNGHSHATELFQDGIYHYHVTSGDPYIAGCYKGTPGKLDN